MASLVAGNAEWLAGESPANKVNCAKFVSFDIADIRHPRYIGPMLLEDFEAERVALHLADALHPSPLQAQVEAADACEQAYESHATPVKRSFCNS